MAKADREGARLVRYSMNFFVILCPISTLTNCAASALYAKWKYGNVNTDKLYRPFGFMYDAINI